jgi:tetratricopeptide (TPR) repeat protein
LRCFNGRSEDSIVYLRQALVRDPAFADAKVKLAVALANQQPPDEPLRLLKEAVETDPHNAEGHYRLALLLTKMGRREESEEQFALFQKYRKP